MHTFQTDIVTRGKLIQIKGKIDDNQLPIAKFLKAYKLRPLGIMNGLTNKIQYKGNQLMVSISFWIIIASSEIYNLFVCSTNTAYEFSIIFCLLYTLCFSTLFNFEKQILYQLVILLLSVGLLAFSILSNLFDTYVAIGIVFTLTTCFLAKLTVYALQYVYNEDATISFSFQSNLLLFQFLCWKIYQITLSQLSIFTFNWDSLLSTIIVFSFINIIKVYKLFDYQIFHVIKIFKIKHQEVDNNDNKNPLKMLKSMNIFIKQQENDSELYSQVKKPTQKLNLNQNKNNAASIDQLFKDLIKQQPKQQQKEQSQIQDTQFEDYQSKRRVHVTALMSLSSICYLAYIIYKQQTTTNTVFSSNIIWYGIGILRTTILLMTCEYQKVLQSQGKHLLNYILIYIGDLTWMLFSAFVMFLPSLINLSNQQSFMLSITPLLTIKLFNYFNRYVHENLENGNYTTLFILWFIPLGFRQIGYAEGISMIYYAIDGLTIVFALIALLVWSGKDDISYFVNQIKTVLVSKKHRLKAFQKLKSTSFQYQKILQNYIYIHIIYLNIMYYNLPDTSLLLTITYLIMYFSPYLLYLLAFINCYKKLTSFIKRYRPSLLNVIILSVSIAYAIVSYLSILSNNHQVWSLVVLLNVSLFVFALEGEKVAVVYMKNYQNFVRTLIITGIFVLIFFPFIVGFSSGYFITNYSQNYLYYYALSGFFYIWCIITIVGVAIHWILNLTDKSKKDLFIAQYMQGQMKKINMKENIDKILMISNMYEVFNYKTQDLLKYLQSQKQMIIITRKQKQFQHDYQLAEPEEKEKKRLSIVAKQINFLDISNMLKAVVNKNQQEIQQNSANPVLKFFKQKQLIKVQQILPPSDINSNQVQLKRMATKLSSIPVNVKQIQKSQQYKNMLTSSNKQISEFMVKLFCFLTTPSKLISRQTFLPFLQILNKQHLSLAETNQTYDKFSQNNLMDQYRFKHFIIDYVNFKYQLNQDSLNSKLRTFCCRDLVPLFLTNFKNFQYYLIRKKINISEQSIQIWLNDKLNEENNSQFNYLRQRQLKKKAKLLKRHKLQKKIFQHNNQDQHQQDNYEQLNDIYRPKKQTLIKHNKKQMKQKHFLKPQNIYSILVNSLIECNLFYEKQSQNFKIKSIKFSISNLLAIITKINDYVFVFGYSTIYIFIAYYNQTYIGSSPIFSVISYPILLIVSGFLVLAYIILIIYHKKDFETGSLGLDENKRSLGLKNLKFYTTSILFLLGSGLANYIISIGLNSFICNQTTSTLYNFQSIQCYNKLQLGYMLISLLILVIYWPLSIITFPFSTSMNRDLQIKYKSQYEILYLQVKFLINGYNTLLNPEPYRTEQLVDCILKVILCSALAVLNNRMQPCSYQLFNMIQGKFYIILILLSFSGVLCYFIGLFYSALATGSMLVLYLIYFVYITFKSVAKLKNQNDVGQILENNIKNQKLKIQIIKQVNNDQLLQNQQFTTISLKGKSKNNLENIDKTKKSIITIQKSQPQLFDQTINTNLDKISNKVDKISNQSKRSVFF